MRYCAAAPNQCSHSALRQETENWRERAARHICDYVFADPRTGEAPAVSRSRNVRSRCRCSVCPAIHINSRSWLRSSSTHEPSDPPHRVVSDLNRYRPTAQHGRKACALAPEYSDPETAFECWAFLPDATVNCVRKVLVRKNLGCLNRPRCCPSLD